MEAMYLTRFSESEESSTSSTSHANLKLRISLAILMGLPASGKTTLANKIEQEVKLCHENTVVTVISYDDFVPIEVQAKCVPLSERSVSKSLRKKFMKSVEYIVETFSKQTVNDSDTTVSLGGHDVSLILLLPDTDTEDLVPNECFISKVDDIIKTVKTEALVRNADSLVLLVDDNHYYKSMRNEFYLIAKSHQTGLCILYCKASINICRQRNLEREDKFQVPNEVIVEMSLKIEEPNPLENVYDSFCIQIENSDQDALTDVEQANIPLILEVLKNTLKYPVDWKPSPDRTKEVERERRICSQNEIHQADQILRKWINKELTLSSFCKKSVEMPNKLQRSKDLNRKKNIVLEKLRSGEFKILVDVEDITFTREVIKFVESVKE